MIKWGLLLIPALVLTMPVLAQTRDTRLADYQVPGSVIVFPKFINRPAITTFGDNADRPIKWDGLIGDAVLRGPNIDVGGGRLRSTAVASYSGIAIQADPALANGALITLGSGGELLFDGAPGHYQAATGKNYGDIKFDNPTARTSGVTPLNALNETWLILLTLDVRSGRPNYPTFVDLDFF